MLVVSQTNKPEYFPTVFTVADTLAILVDVSLGVSIIECVTFVRLISNPYRSCSMDTLAFDPPPSEVKFNELPLTVNPVTEKSPDADILLT